MNKKDAKNVDEMREKMQEFEKKTVKILMFHAISAFKLIDYLI